MTRHVDHTLDELLGMWARSRRLSAPDARNMKAYIVTHMVATKPQQPSDAAAPAADQRAAGQWAAGQSAAWDDGRSSVAQALRHAWSAGAQPSNAPPQLRDEGAAVDVLSPLWWRDVAQAIATQTMAATALPGMFGVASYAVGV